MKTEGKLVTCDYPSCTKQVMLRKIGEGETDGGYTKYDKYEPMPEGWGYKDNKDLCPDHHQCYLDMIQEFWDPTMPYEYVEQSIGKHSVQEIDALAEMLEVDNSVKEPVLKDEDILYTNMPEMNAVKVTGPSGTVEGHVQEDW